MSRRLDDELAGIRRSLLDPARLVRAVAAGRRRGVAPPPWRRVELRYVDLAAGRRLQLVSSDATQAFTRNLDPADAAAAVDEVLGQPYGSWHVDTVDATTQLRVTKKGAAQVHRTGSSAPAARGVADAAGPQRSHDRGKRRLLDPADPFLVAVGISDADGRVKPSRQDKLRQVEQMLRTLEPVLGVAAEHAAAQPGAAGDPTLRVVDLGCGNAYLTFAAYRRLVATGHRPELVGVDVKAQSRQRNTDLAAALGAEGARFVEGTIAEVVVDPPPHLVLALHACDTATDEALARAVRWQAPVVLAAPCCHHDLQRQLNDRLRTGSGPPAPYGLLGRHGILRERTADVLTDALRAAVLRMLGYRVDVVEFVDSKHTPRNVALRAVRTGAAADPGVVADYRAMTQAWGVRPALARMLAPDLRPIVDGD